MMDMSTIQRALGILEGVSYGVSDEAADAILTAVEMIEGALKND